MSRNIATTTSSYTKEDQILANTQNGKLIFTQQRGLPFAFLIQNDRLIAAQVLSDNVSKVGAIYIGKVKKVVKNIEACFVEISSGELCFLPFKEAKTPYLLNRSFDMRILEGDELLVQVTKDAQKTKQASVTAHISLSNEAFAISLGNPHVGYSNKLSKKEKDTIQTFFTAENIIDKGMLLSPKEYDTLAKLPLSTGMVVRTLAGKLSKEELKKAYESLLTDWVELLRTALTRTCYTCLKEPSNGLEMIVEQLVYSSEYSEVITDQKELYDQLLTIFSASHQRKLVRLYEDTSFPLSKLYSLESKLDTALNTRIWLKSGGYLVIEPTEALTVIDVNSGKYEARKENQEAIYRINMEAAKEIALQLRLRNLSGIIVADFINMSSTEKAEELLHHLRSLVRMDKQKTSVIDITALGLVEITRKKVHKPLWEQLK